ncbi:MAG: sodium/proton-translocating pyrophosphatase, partial [Armatimonadetes bacterium]|nr:sodium/proton-translocating pyrophosphatase [Armatimonadota bacterium]
MPSDVAAYGAAGAAIVSLIFAAATARWITRADAGSGRMQEVAAAIREGAMAFLAREYRVLALFVVAVAFLLVAFISRGVAVAFIIGAVLSVSAGNIGMRIATRANVRTAQAARTGLAEGLRVAFRSGAVMGFAV